MYYCPACKRSDVDKATTPKVKVDDLYICQDCADGVNPTQAKAQKWAGVIMLLGAAATAGLIYSLLG